MPWVATATRGRGQWPDSYRCHWPSVVKRFHYVLADGCTVLAEESIFKQIVQPVAVVAVFTYRPM